MAVYKFWTNKEIERLIEIWPRIYSRPRGVIMEMFPGRSWSSIKWKAYKLGLGHKRTFRVPGQPRAIKQLFEIMKYGDQAKIARAMGTRKECIGRWRWKRGVSIRRFEQAVMIMGYKIVLVKSGVSNVEPKADQPTIKSTRLPESLADPLPVT